VALKLQFYNVIINAITVALQLTEMKEQIQVLDMIKKMKHS